MSKRRVVITGLGLISPVGNDVETGWSNLVAGRSGIGEITRFDTSTFPTRIAGEVKGFDAADWMPAKEAQALRHLHPLRRGGVAAGLPRQRHRGDRRRTPSASACSSAPGIGGLPLIEETHTEFASRGIRRVSPFFVPGSIINMVSGQLSIMLGLQGPELRDRQRLHHRTALHRRRRPDDRLRRRRRDGGRRHRSDRFAARRRRLLRGARAVHAQRRSADREPALGPGPRRLRARRGRGRGDPGRTGACAQPRRAHLRASSSASA